ncbi:MAG: hypothetical protein NTU54_08170, partial [Candidatus Omnitrophica bacterium]|nr:hypothetical protein [Candidatus Omnitrophota bacterium]
MGQPYSAGLIAVEAIKSKIAGISVEDIKKSIAQCFAMGWSNSAGLIAVEAIKSKIAGISVEDVKNSIAQCFAMGRLDLAAKIAVEAIKSKIEGISAEDVKGWIVQCFAMGWLDSAGLIALEAVKSKIEGISAGDVKGWITYNYRLGSAGLIAVEAIKSKIAGISVEDVKNSIAQCFAIGWSDSAGLIAVEAAREYSLTRTTSRIISSLKQNQLLGGPSIAITTAIILYALRHNRLDALGEVLFWLQGAKYLPAMLIQLIRLEGEEEILGEIFKEDGRRNIMELCRNIYSHIFDPLLPQEIDIHQPRVNALLRSIVRFDTSEFSGDSPKTFEQIYDDYLKAYRAGQISLLPAGMPPSKVIEVATKRHMAIRPATTEYYRKIKSAADEALRAIRGGSGANLYRQPVNQIMPLLESEIKVLENREVELRSNPMALDGIRKRKDRLIKIRASLSRPEPAAAGFPLLALDALELKELMSIPSVEQPVRLMLFIFALSSNAGWKDYFAHSAPQELTQEAMRQLIVFINSFIKPHLLDGMNDISRRAILKGMSTKQFEDELKLVDRPPSTFRRRIGMRLTRGWLAEYIGFISDECWTRSTDIMSDKSGMIALVLFDEETNELLGGTLFMSNKVGGKKVLIDRGFSPRIEVTADLDMDNFMQQVTDYEMQVAKALDAEMLLVPLRALELGLGSNNPDVIQYYERTVGQRQPVNLEIPNKFNGHDITNGKCVVLREVRVEGAATVASPATNTLADKPAAAPVPKSISPHLDSARGRRGFIGLGGVAKWVGEKIAGFTAAPAGMALQDIENDSSIIKDVYMQIFGISTMIEADGPVENVTKRRIKQVLENDRERWALLRELMNTNGQAHTMAVALLDVMLMRNAEHEIRELMRVAGQWHDVRVDRQKELEKILTHLRQDVHPLSQAEIDLYAAKVKNLLAGYGISGVEQAQLNELALRVMSAFRFAQRKGDAQIEVVLNGLQIDGLTQGKIKIDPAAIDWISVSRASIAAPPTAASAAAAVSGPLRGAGGETTETAKVSPAAAPVVAGTPKAQPPKTPGLILPETEAKYGHLPRWLVGWIAAVVELHKSPFAYSFLWAHGEQQTSKERIPRIIGIGAIWVAMEAGILYGLPFLGVATGLGLIPAFAISLAVPNFLVHGIYNTLALRFGFASLRINEETRFFPHLHTVPFNKFVSALRNNIGKPSPGLYESIRGRILRGESPLRDSDHIGNDGNVKTLNTFIEEHFAVPEEAAREIITNAYDSMHNEPDPARRIVDVRLADGFMSVRDHGTGMSLDTILKKLFPPFEGTKSNPIFARIKSIIEKNGNRSIPLINQFIAGIDRGELSDIERLTLEDIENRLRVQPQDVGSCLKAIENMLTFTGRFGIGFYSILYFMKTGQDTLEVVTSTGQEAYRITFFRQEGELRTAIEVMDPNMIERGTTVTLMNDGPEKSFDMGKARKMIHDYLAFNASAEINLSVNEEAPELVNAEVFNPDIYEHIHDPAAHVEAFYSRDENTEDKCSVLINVNGVTIMHQIVHGYGMPPVVVFNFPPNMGLQLPISRNNILVNEFFIEKARDMIGLIASRPQLLSAFFPCIEILESNAKASLRNILTHTAVEAARNAWDSSLVYLPNTKECAKIRHQGVRLVDERLLRLLLQSNFSNSYHNVLGAPVSFATGAEALVGAKRVYAVDLSDETKFVALDDAILINRKYLPEVESDKALYNTLLTLSKEGRFAYSYQPRAPEAAAEASPAAPPAGKPTLAEETLSPDYRQKLQKALAALPDEGAKAAFKNVFLSIIMRYGIGYETEEEKFLAEPGLFLIIYNELLKPESITDFDYHWPSIFHYIYGRWYSGKTDGLKSMFAGGRLRQLWSSCKEKRIDPAEILNYLFVLGYSTGNQRTEQVIFTALDRILELRDYFNSATLLHLILPGAFLDADTYSKLRRRIAADSEKLYQSYSIIIYHICSQYHLFPSQMEVLELVINGDYAALDKINVIYDRLKDKYNHQGYVNEMPLAISMRNMSEPEIERFISSGGYIDASSIPTGHNEGLSLFFYYFRFFYGEQWQEQLNRYLKLKNRGGDIFSLEYILESSLPVELKKALCESVIAYVDSSSENLLRGATTVTWRVRCDFDPALWARIRNPALFFVFLMYAQSVFGNDFLHRKYSRETRNKDVPPGGQYILRYNKELFYKLTVVYAQASSLPVAEFYEALRDFTSYFTQGKTSSRIEPYIDYLLSSQDAPAISDQELNVRRQRRFSLVGLYDTFLDLSSEAEKSEEAQGALGNFSGTDSRIESVKVQKLSLLQRLISGILDVLRRVLPAFFKSHVVSLRPALSREREDLLRNSFKAAAQQSVDDLVMLRELVQNVLDEVNAGHVGQREGQKISINTYRKPAQAEKGQEELTVIDIRDMVGMNAERLFNKLLMPFSSSKADPERLRGKQGQGFFTLLANSEYVVIRTVKNGAGRLIRLTPERQDGQVVDFWVEEEFIQVQAGEADGTQIQVFVKNVFPGLEASRVYAAVRKFASLVDSRELNIEVNGSTINDNADNRLAVERTAYGDISFYSLAGESFMALGGLFVKPLDDKFLEMIPSALKPILLGHGFAVNLPFQHIRRIQGGSDIAEREKVYAEIKDAIAICAVKLAVAMFARGELPSLDLLGYDYYDYPVDTQAIQDAREIIEGTAVIDDIRQRYFPPGHSNQLSELLLAIPLDFLRDVFDRPMSLSEIFNQYRADRASFTPQIMGRLPQSIKGVLQKIEAKEIKANAQPAAFQEMGLPGEFVDQGFIELPAQQGPGMAAFWAFLEMSDALAEIGIKQMLRENSAQALGNIGGRLAFLSDHPMRGRYYAAANQTLAHALKGGDAYAWNLLEQQETIRLFSLFLKRQIYEEEFLDKVLERIMEILSHELVHIIEGTQEGTHNDVFYARQKLLLSAFIGAKAQVAQVLARIAMNQQYIDNAQEVSVKDFLAYIAAQHRPPAPSPGEPVVSNKNSKDDAQRLAQSRKPLYLAGLRYDQANANSLLQGVSPDEIDALATRLAAAANPTQVLKEFLVSQGLAVNTTDASEKAKSILALCQGGITPQQLAAAQADANKARALQFLQQNRADFVHGVIVKEGEGQAGAILTNEAAEQGIKAGIIGLSNDGKHLEYQGGFKRQEGSGLYLPDKTIVAAGGEETMLAGLQRKKAQYIEEVNNSARFQALGYERQKEILSELAGDIAMIPLDDARVKPEMDAYIDILCSTSGINPQKRALRPYLYTLILKELGSYQAMNQMQLSRIQEFLATNKLGLTSQGRDFRNAIDAYLMGDAAGEGLAPGKLWKMDDGVFMRQVRAIAHEPMRYRREGLKYLPKDMQFGIEIEVAAIDARGERDEAKTQELIEALPVALKAGGAVKGWDLGKDPLGNFELASPKLSNTREDWARLEVDLGVISRTVLKEAKRLDIDVKHGIHVHASMPESGSPETIKALTYIGKAYEGLWDALAFGNKLRDLSFGDEAIFGDATTAIGGTFIYDGEDKGLAHNALKPHGFNDENYAASVQCAVEVFLNTVYQATTHPEIFNVFSGGIPLTRDLRDPELENRLVRHAIDTLGVSWEGKRTFIKMLAEGGFFQSGRPVDLSRIEEQRLRALYEAHSLGYLFDIHLQHNGWRNGNIDASGMIAEVLEHINDPAVRIEVITAICEGFFDDIRDNPQLLKKISLLKGMEEIKDKILIVRPGKILQGHSGAVLGAPLIDAQTIMSWSNDSTLRLWDRETGECIRTLKGHSSWVNGATLIDAQTIMSWSNDSTLRLWDRETGKCIKTLQGHSGAVLGASLIDPQTIMSWSRDGTLRLWDRETGKCIKTLQGHSGPVYGASLIDAQTIMSWSGDGTLRLWDRATGECIRTLKGHSSWVNGATLIDAQTIMSWSWDGTLRLWDRETGKCIKTLQGHS